MMQVKNMSFSNDDVFLMLAFLAGGEALQATFFNNSENCERLVNLIRMHGVKNATQVVLYRGRKRYSADTFRTPGPYYPMSNGTPSPSIVTNVSYTNELSTAVDFASLNCCIYEIDFTPGIPMFNVASFLIGAAKQIEEALKDQPKLLNALHYARNENEVLVVDCVITPNGHYEFKKVFTKQDEVREMQFYNATAKPATEAEKWKYEGPSLGAQALRIAHLSTFTTPVSHNLRPSSRKISNIKLPRSPQPVSVS